MHFWKFFFKEAGPVDADLTVSKQEAGPQRLQTDVDLGCNFFVQAEV